MAARAAEEVTPLSPERVAHRAAEGAADRSTNGITPRPTWSTRPVLQAGGSPGPPRVATDETASQAPETAQAVQQVTCPGPLADLAARRTGGEGCTEIILDRLMVVGQRREVVGRDARRIDLRLGIGDGLRDQRLVGDSFALDQVRVISLQLGFLRGGRQASLDLLRVGLQGLERGLRRGCGGVLRDLMEVVSQRDGLGHRDLRLGPDGMLVGPQFLQVGLQLRARAVRRLRGGGHGRRCVRGSRRGRGRADRGRRRCAGSGRLGRRGGRRSRCRGGSCRGGWRCRRRRCRRGSRGGWRGRCRGRRNHGWRCQSAMPTMSVQTAMLSRSVISEGGMTTLEMFQSRVSPENPGPQGKELAPLQGVALQCRPGRDTVPISPRFARAQRGQELP